MTDLLDMQLFAPALAKKRMRYLASVIDYLIYCSFIWFVQSTFGNTYTTVDGIRHYDVNGYPALACFIFWFLIPVAESLGGQSLGKMMCKIKVVKMDYDTAGMGRCIARHLFDIIDFFPFFGITGLIVASNTTLKQRVGDLVAKTIVVQA